MGMCGLCMSDETGSQLSDLCHLVVRCYQNNSQVLLATSDLYNGEFSLILPNAIPL